MRHPKRKIFWAVLIVIALLVAARVVLPHVLQRYVNETLDSAKGYGGHVGDIDLALWRGGYVIENVEINKAEGEVFAPLFSADRVELALLTPALLRGELVGEIALHYPELNIVLEEDAEEPESEVPKSAEQTGEAADWQRVLTDLFPLRFDLVEIHQGEIHLRKPDSDPKVDLYLTNLDATLKNLTNSRDLSDSLVANLDLTADAMRNGSLTVSMQMNPYRELPHFDFNGKLVNLKMDPIDPLVRAYTPLDVEAGTLDLVVELAARDGHITGYIKPLLHDVEIFQWRPDVVKQDDNLLQLAWEGLVDVVGEVFENQARDQFATRIPIDGQISGPNVEVIPAVINILRNAFINAFEAQLEGEVSPADIPETTEESDSSQ